MDGQLSPEVQACNGFASEWGVCPSLPACFEPVHCKFDAWEDWYYGGGCTGVCFRSRQVKEFSDDYGKACSGALETTKDCTTDPTYISSCYNGADQGYALYGESACKWRDWSEWSDCSRPCGGGEKSRDRHIDAAPDFGGAPCAPVDTSEYKPCNEQSCMTCTDGQWAPWQPWQKCSVTCGSGLQWRQRDYAVQANQCGRPATGSRQEYRPCHGAFSDEEPSCPADISHQRCMLGDWEDWQTCQAQCDVGRRPRRRPFLMDDVRHYVADLEAQVFALQAGNDHIEQDKNGLLLNITDLQRRIKEMQKEDVSVQKRLDRAITSRDRLKANASEFQWQRDQLQADVKRLEQEKMVLQTKADQLAVELRDLSTVNGSRGDQVSPLIVVALLVFAAAIGLICGCFGNGCKLLSRRRHRTAAYNVDDAPDTMSIAGDEKDTQTDIEDQPWRPVPHGEASDMEPLAAE